MEHLPIYNIVTFVEANFNPSMLQTDLFTKQPTACNAEQKIIFIIIISSSTIAWQVQKESRKAVECNIYYCILLDIETEGLIHAYCCSEWAQG